MNVKLLEQIQKAITLEPKRLRMNVWAQHFDNRADAPANLPPCGTVGCIAGWAAILNEKNEGNEPTIAAAVGALWIGEAEMPLGERGAAALDLSHKDAQRLFYVDNWPADLKSAYHHQEEQANYRGMARITVKRIQRFIDTDGKE